MDGGGRRKDTTFRAGAGAIHEGLSDRVQLDALGSSGVHRLHICTFRAQTGRPFPAQAGDHLEEGLLSPLLWPSGRSSRPAASTPSAEIRAIAWAVPQFWAEARLFPELSKVHLAFT